MNGVTFISGNSTGLAKIREPLIQIGKSEYKSGFCIQIFQSATMVTLLALGIEIVPVSAEHAVMSGQIKGRLSIPYADAFGVELASASSGSVLITADFDVKAAASEVQIEFLPTK